MFSYYFRLALVSMRRNPILSALMIAAIGLGIGASMTTITVNYVMSSNPIPHKSDDLYYVQLDSWDPNNAASEPNEPPDQVTWTDAMNLMRDAPALRQGAQAKSSLVLEPPGDDERPFMVLARTNFADFFPMFDLPFLYGSGWDRDADDARELVVVLSREINDRVFGGENSVGQTLRLGGQHFRVVGVLDEWSPMPKFYDVTNGPFDEPEEVFIPFNTMVDFQFSRSGNTNCWKAVDGSGFEAFLRSECVWIQFWAELPTQAARDEYMQFLNSYVEQQKALGRFPRPMNNRLSNVMQWMENQEVVDDDAQVMMWLSLMFLVVCLLNTVGLLLSKFLAKSHEIGLRRAVGASRQQLFTQHLVESATIGLAGGVLGLGLAWLGLRGIELLFGDMVDRMTNMDWVMVLAAIGLAIVSAILAGLYPTWRACNVQPAAQLKSI